MAGPDSTRLGEAPAAASSASRHQAAGAFVGQGDRQRYSSGYSRMVFAMKVLLPAIAVALVILVVAWPQFGEDKGRFSLSEAKVEIGGSDATTVINARFVGTDAENRPFVVTAAEALQESARPDEVLLMKPEADMTIEGGAWVAMRAESGVFHRSDETIDLSGGVSLFHDSGYEFHSPTARIELKGGRTTGNDPIRGQGPVGTVDAEGFEILDRGRHILFTGQSRMVLYPQ